MGMLTQTRGTKYKEHVQVGDNERNQFIWSKHIQHRPINPLVGQGDVIILRLTLRKKQCLN